MAGENSNVPAQNEWELLSMTGSTIGQPSSKPQDSDSAEEEEPPAKKEFQSQTQEYSKDAEPSPAVSHKDLTSSDESETTVSTESSNEAVKAAWWKRKGTSGQPQSEKYNTMLSVALVAAVLGIAVIGHRWYRERNLNHQLRMDIAAKEEKLSDVMQQFKEAVTGRRRIGITRSSFF